MEEWMADKDLTQYSNIPVLHYSNVPPEPLNSWAGRGYS